MAVNYYIFFSCLQRLGYKKLDKKEEEIYNPGSMKVLLLLTILMISCHTRDETLKSGVMGLADTTDDPVIITDIRDREDTYTDITEIPFSECKKMGLALSEDNDSTDIYLPAGSEDGHYLILVLQGADLTRENYSAIADRTCRYGFAVAVPDHYKNSFSGRHLYAEENATNELFRKIIKLSEEKDSLLYNRIRKERFILMGHSYGAGCGLFMINNECKWPFCSDKYTRPDELSAGIFYGISLKSPFGETYYTIDNRKIPVLLMAGDNDGAIKYEYAEKTFGSILHTPRIFVRLRGANHYAINNTNPPPG